MARAFAILRFQRLHGGKSPVNAGDMEDVYRRVVAAIERAGSRWALVGAHAVNTYVRPRATDDIDLVVEGRKLRAIQREIAAELGEQRVDDIGAAVRLLDLGVDLIRSDNHVLFRAALDTASDREGARVPPAELLVALKFLSATSPWRSAAQRGQDTVDLIAIYQALGDDLDRAAAERYASQVYEGAAAELREVLDRVDRGEKVQI
jgi:hypothetical protein